MSNSNIDVANYASDRYTASIREIERIKNGIYHNRKGSVSLTDIQPPDSSERLARRIEREGLPTADAVERINGVRNFQDVVILKKILSMSESVCRLLIRSPFGTSGYGTGFLIARNLIITNNHVFPAADAAERSLAQFRYELQSSGASDPVTFRLRPDIFFMTSPIQKEITIPYSGLDFTIVAVEEKSEEGVLISDLRPVKLDESVGKILDGENCIVIQHPGGDYKKVVLKDIRMLTLTDNFLIYESDTLPGSSGSMVVGLGTGEVVALHHSGVPRRNDKGDWLRKNGTISEPGDADDIIDWIGNEGIRVSSILKAIRKIEIPKEMEKYRTQIFENSLPSEKQASATHHEPTLHIESLAAPDPSTSSVGLQYFEVELSSLEALQEDWKANFQALLPGVIKSEPIFPLASEADQRRFYYLTVKSDKDPWELSAHIEALPHIDACTPDISVFTDIGLSAINMGGMPKGQESTLESFFYNDGTAHFNEDKFIESWKNSVNCKDEIQANDLPAIRRWNWKACRFKGVQNHVFSSASPTEEEKTELAKLKKNLQQLKFIQLDTGYSSHSKVSGSYDLNSDMDFIDNDEDARDEQAKWGFKFPNHGTRTASLVIGGKIKPSYEFEGNSGILNDNGSALLKLIPYRIAKTVVLFGRGKDMVDAANHAINIGADVMFICMGSYPRPMMEKVAQQAYESGVIWVCAAGNEVEMVIAPALYPGTIAVAAINPNEMPWKGTSYGEAVDISAPGESVYVPFIDESGKEIMAYGDGTSYATPHVAAAAALWKAKYSEQLKSYGEKWQIVEAFRKCLQASARKPKDDWKVKMYGTGILDIEKLLRTPPPDPKELTHAYRDKSIRSKFDLGVREAIDFLWKTLKRKVTPGHQEEAMEYAGMTNRGRTALTALMKSQPNGRLEATTISSPVKSKKILNDYFESFRK